jgi:predicted dehydrogenase
VLAETSYSVASEIKPGSWKTGRGTPLVQLGIHHADTIAYLLGPVARTTGRLTRPLGRDLDVDDVGVAVLELESGALATICSSYVSPKAYSLRLHGTGAVLDYRTDMSVWPAADRLDELTTLTLAGEDVPFERVDPLAAELTAFARCVAGEDEPETGAAEGIAALKVILDAIATADAG